MLLLVLLLVTVLFFRKCVVCDVALFALCVVLCSCCVICVFCDLSYCAHTMDNVFLSLFSVQRILRVTHDIPCVHCTDIAECSRSFSFGF